MRVIRFATIATMVLATAVSVHGQPSTADPEALINVLRSLNAPGATETPVVNQTEDGYIDFLSAPSGGIFMVPPSAAKAATSAGKAQAFMTEHKAAFGVVNEDVALTQKSTMAHGTQNFVRFGQRYRSVPIFGAEVVVQVAGDAGIGAVNSSLLYNTAALDNGDLSLTPGITQEQAVAAAKTEFAKLFSAVGDSDISVVVEPVLEIYDATLLGMDNELTLVWRLALMTQKEELTSKMMLVNAHTTKLELQYDLAHAAMNRIIYDADGVTLGSIFDLRVGQPVRVEGTPPTGDTDVDNVFDFLGDTYNFYYSRHNRDSYDDAGSDLEALVNVGNFPNAMWVGGEGYNMMVYGEGFVTDDITAHEVTHGVIDSISDLIYFGESGALNEFISDVWGEYVDLTNGRGNDSPEVRWLLGEDIDCGGEIEECAGRNMADPPQYFQPDRMGSELWFNTNSMVDNGGVHINSGVGNKLCYLLTDGDSFNGYTVNGMGIDQTAELFYAAHLLLTQTSGYHEFYLALGAAASELGYSFSQRLNVGNACQAVEIVPEASGLNAANGFRALSVTTGGQPAIALYWENAPLSAFNENILIKSVGTYAMAPGDGLTLPLSSPQADRYLDTQVNSGVEYLYSLIVDLAEGFPQILFARAVAGESASGILSEAFGENLAEEPAPAFDLAYSQLLYSPVGPEKSPLGEDSSGGSLNDYEVTITRNVGGLPVARDDVEGGSHLILLTDEDYVSFGSGYAPIPLFGKNYTRWILSSNGYVAPAPLSDWGSNWPGPGLSKHFDIPRVSLLFADLAPNINGNIWVRYMPDRIVVTYETVPEYPDAWWYYGLEKSAESNTAQLEMFYSGHFRMTYQEINVKDAIVGLSDGNGMLVDPAELFPEVDSIDFYTDLSESSETPELLSFDVTSDAPLVQIAAAGEQIQFDVRAIAPGAPVVLTAEWDGVGPVPFVDNGNATGTFIWNTLIEDGGIYTVRIKARLGELRAYVDVHLLVGEVYPDPVASNLLISSGTPGEDPSVDHEVDLGRALYASYDYNHVWEGLDPLWYGEGESVVYWWRNDQMIEGLTGSNSAPIAAMADGDRWRFSVIPITLDGIPGEEVSSAMVTIVGDPIITAILPPRGLVEGGATIQIKGKRLDGPLAITFGGLQITEFTSLGYDAIELVTPPHAEGYVSVSVTTAAGTATAVDAFKYVTDPADLLKEDVNLDGKVDAIDVQLVTNAVLELKGTKSLYTTDVNLDGATNVADVQCVVSKALHRK